MVAVILQALGDVLGADAGLVGDGPEVDDELVRARAVLAGEQDGVVVPEPLHHVVGVENRALGRVRQTFAAHHGDVRE